MRTENKVLNSSDLRELISHKEEIMIKDVFTNYTKEKKVELAKRYSILDENENSIKYILLAMAISLIINPIGLMTDNTWMIKASVSLVLLVIIYTMSSSFKNKNINRWFSYSSNINYLYMRMFGDVAVDEDVLRLFVKIYGNEELVQLIVNKENLTYTDIQLYINNNTEKESMKNKMNKIREAVDCLSK